MSAGVGVPPVDAALARRVEAADVEYVVARQEWLAARPGDPVGAAVHRIGGAVVLRSPGMRTPMFNRIMLAEDSVVPRLYEVISAAGGGAAPLRFDLLPPLRCHSLAHALIRRGFACTGHFTGLYGAARRVDRPRRFDGTIRTMRDAEIDDWIDVYISAFGISRPDAEPMGSSLRALPRRQDATLLV